MDQSQNSDQSNAVVKAPELPSKKEPPSKKAMSILHEWCAYRGINPKYDLEKVEGHDHCPTFFYTVTAGDLAGNASGSSTSKRAAKHAAAQGLLDLIAQNAAGQNGTLGTTMEAMDQDKEENPSGKLQEMCLAHSWPVPVFEKPQVVVTCRVGNQEVTGYGEKKKQAKREAANAMIKLLQNMPNQESWRTGV